MFYFEFTKDTGWACYVDLFYMLDFPVLHQENRSRRVWVFDWDVSFWFLGLKREEMKI